MGRNIRKPSKFSLGRQTAEYRGFLAGCLNQNSTRVSAKPLLNPLLPGSTEKACLNARGTLFDPLDSLARAGRAASRLPPPQKTTILDNLVSELSRPRVPENDHFREISGGSAPFSIRACVAQCTLLVQIKCAVAKQTHDCSAAPRQPPQKKAGKITKSGKCTSIEGTEAGGPCADSAGCHDDFAWAMLRKFNQQHRRCPASE